MVRCGSGGSWGSGNEAERWCAEELEGGEGFYMGTWGCPEICFLARRLTKFAK